MKPIAIAVGCPHEVQSVKFFGPYQIDVTHDTTQRTDPYQWHLFEIGSREPFLSSLGAFRSETAAFVDAKNVVRRQIDRKTGLTIGP